MTMTTTTTRARRRVRFVPAVVAVVLLLLGAEVVVRVVEDRLPPPSGWISDEYPMKIDQIDDLADDGGVGVVLLGSSVTDTAVDPALLGDAATGGRGAYNAGLIAATPVITETWAGELVVPRLRPDTVVIAVSSRDLNGNGAGMRSQDERFRSSLGGESLLGTHSLADGVEWWLLEHSALVRNRESLRRPIEAFTDYDPPDRNATEITELGFETHLLDEQYRSDDVALDFFRREPLRDFAVTDDQLDALRRLVAHLEDGGVRVVLLDVPVTEDYIELHPRGADDMAAYEEAIDEVAAETGADVLRPGVWPTELFSDPLHVNGAGVERLSAELDAYLAGG